MLSVMTDAIELIGSAVPRRASGAVQAEVDGELILLSPKDFGYFGAEGAGGAVWELVDGERTVDGIVTALEADFVAEPGVIRGETLTYLEALVAAGLVEV